jgi:hypothetical protein
MYRVIKVMKRATEWIPVTSTGMTINGVFVGDPGSR